MFTIMRYNLSSQDAKPVSAHFTLDEARNVLQEKWRHSTFIQYPKSALPPVPEYAKKHKDVNRKPRLTGFKRTVKTKKE